MWSANSLEGVCTLAHTRDRGNKSQINLTVRIQIYVDGLCCVCVYKRNMVKKYLKKLFTRI